MYLDAWESMDVSRTHSARLVTTKETTTFFLGKDEKFKVTDLTKKALDGLTMNYNSMDAMDNFMQRNDFNDTVCWRPFSTMAVENFFSKIRSINPIQHTCSSQTLSEQLQKSCILIE